MSEVVGPATSADGAVPPAPPAPPVTAPELAPQQPPVVNPVAPELAPEQPPVAPAPQQLVHRVGLGSVIAVDVDAVAEFKSLLRQSTGKPVALLDTIVWQNVKVDFGH